MYTTTAIFIAETPYKSLIFAVFMSKKEKIADILVSTILNSNGGDKGIRTPDLYVANVSLYHLSYIPIIFFCLLRTLKF